MGRLFKSLLCAVVLALAAIGVPANAQAPTQNLLRPEQLDQILAPIALYPDALLAQILMAATYPLEVVEAARWSKANPALKGDAAVKAVADKSWDVSVKSLVAFPQTIQQMSDQLDWTQKLGDAMLSQQQDVAQSVQRLRRRAQDAGNLKTTAQQTVTQQPTPGGSAAPQTIIIQPASPQLIYVPVYQPSWVYGPWPHAAYPPYYYPPYPGFGYGAAMATGFVWGVGVAAAGSWFGGWNWGTNNVNVDINRAVNIDRNFDRNKYQNGNWQHQPEHRRGVAYRDAASRQQYGKSVPGADGRRDFRGKDVVNPQAGAGQRPGGAGAPGGQRPGNAGQGPGAGPGPRPGGAGPGQGAVGTGPGQRPGGQQLQRPGGPQGSGAFQGIDRGGQRTGREAARGRSSGGFQGGGGPRAGGGGRR